MSQHTPTLSAGDRERIVEALREGSTVLDEPFHRESIRMVMLEAADLLASQAATPETQSDEQTDDPSRGPSFPTVGHGDLSHTPMGVVSAIALRAAAHRALKELREFMPTTAGETITQLEAALGAEAVTFRCEHGFVRGMKLCSACEWPPACTPAGVVSATAPEHTQRESWAVTVERNGEQVVTIASNCLSGRDLSPEDEAVIRKAAAHLLSFIGCNNTGIA